MEEVEWSETRDGEEWDKFVIENGGCFFHLWSWRKVLEDCGSRPLYLACRDAKGSTLAVCPFFHQTDQHRQYLDSLPDSRTAGPVVAKQSANVSQIIAALPKSIKSSSFRPVAAMRIKTHQEQVAKSMLDLGFPSDTERGLFVLNLQDGVLDDIWKNGFGKHDRQAVKFYERLATFGFAGSGHDYLALTRPSWRTYQFELLELPHPDFISKMKAILGDRIEIALATDSSGVALAGFLMLLDHPGSLNPGVHMLAIKHTPSRNIHSVVTFINWKAASWAYQHGFRYVDFGTYPIAESSNPTNKFHKLKERFRIVLVPRYRFTLPLSGVSFSITKRVSRTLWGTRLGASVSL